MQNGNEQKAEDRQLEREQGDKNRVNHLVTSGSNNGSGNNGYVKPTSAGVREMSKAAESLLGGIKKYDKFGRDAGDDLGKADQKNWIVTRALYLRQKDGGKQPEVFYVRQAHEQMKASLAAESGQSVPGKEDTVPNPLATPKQSKTSKTLGVKW
jgi:hypothetical protein